MTTAPLLKWQPSPEGSMYEVYPGLGMTLRLAQDSYPYVIVGVMKKFIRIRRVHTDGLEPSHYCNGFPVFFKEFSAEELEQRYLREGAALKAYLHKDGQYYLGGSRLSPGARYFRNYAD